MIKQQYYHNPKLKSLYDYGAISHYHYQRLYFKGKLTRSFPVERVDPDLAPLNRPPNLNLERVRKPDLLPRKCWARRQNRTRKSIKYCNSEFGPRELSHWLG